MAGNIVKWWKHKILGGYKQFSVLQECTTDSEELIYPIRAPSTCSAPPDLLLTSDREPIIGGSKMQQQHHHHSIPKDIKVTKKTKPLDSGGGVAGDGVGGVDNEAEKMLLEEFTCDVSVEGGKSSQPLQFSFTFYDLDGHHHGKITKDDIAGIVYTIYESIGKSVVVPHCGSKTINVRLTVSPDAKSKSTTKKGITAIKPRKTRFKPRKLIPTDDDDDEDAEDSCGSVVYENCQQYLNAEPRVPNAQHPIIGAAESVSTQPTVIPNSTKQDRKCNLFISENTEPNRSSNKDLTSDGCCDDPKLASNDVPKKSLDCHNNMTSTPLKNTPLRNKNCSVQENVYESIGNLKCCTKLPNNNFEGKIDANGCVECSSQCPLVDISNGTPTPPVAKTNFRKLLRKSRSKKQKDRTCHTRVRSLSVGNENCYRNGRVAASREGGADECLNNLRRNDLIDIIRQSMEKNRLCFQTNGKTAESPVRHRHRSHTISKIVGEQTDPKIQITANNHSQVNRCGYDSFLHATICTNNVTTITHPAVIVQNSSKNVQNHNNRAIRARHKLNDASPQLQGYTKLNSSTTAATKLNTSALSQLNPHLTPEQKFSRTINHVEKWLTERDQVLTKTNNDLRMIKFNEDSRNKNKDIVVAKDEKNIDNLINTKIFVDKLKLTEKFTEKCTETTPKKTFNKEALLLRKTTKIQQQSAVQRNSNTKNLLESIKTKGSAMEYASIPISVDPIECENLLRTSSDADSCQSPADTASTVHHRYVHEHIHHHYHHFENGSEIL